VSSATAILEQLDERTQAILERRRTLGRVQRRGWLVRRALLAADIAGLSIAFGIAEQVFGDGISRAGHLGTPGEFLLFLATLPAWVVAAKLYGLYDKDEERTDHSTTDDFAGVFHLVTVVTWLLYAVSRVTPEKPEFQKLLVFWACAVVSVPLARAAGRSYCRRQIQYLQNTAIVGAGDVGHLIARKVLQHPEYGLNLVGFVDEDPRETPPELAHIAVLGGSEDLPSLVRLLDIERVVIAFSNEPHEETLAMLHEIRRMNVQVDIVPRFFENVGPDFGLHMIEGLPLVGLPPSQLSRSSALLKRGLDVALSLTGLALLAPLFFLIAMLVKLDSWGPVIYRHERVGLRGRSIDVFKFRTMRREACRGSRYGGDAADEMFRELLHDPGRAREFDAMYKLANDPRITRVGRFLRRSSLDELPQLINVLKGDISLVGPRPVTATELSRYGPRVDELLGVRPGVTGYWQINGRSRLTYEDRVRLDLSYISGWSLKLDLAILAKTLRTLVVQDDAR
jgi:exopolysaccharide biosynthesis polyprenyl glycosylphosphotransferase